MPATSKQSDATFQVVLENIWKHLEERDWTRVPNRTLAISIALEANELLEHYQWDEDAIGDKDALAEELADIFIYAFNFAERNGIDIPKAIEKKLDKSAKKYPSIKFKGVAEKNQKNLRVEAKLKHIKDGL